MIEPDVLDSPAPPKRRRRLLWLGMILLLLFVGCGGFYGFLLFTTNGDVKQAMAEADRLEPDGWRIEELDAHRTELRDEDNAALVVRAARAKLPGNWSPLRTGLAQADPVAEADDGAPALMKEEIALSAPLPYSVYVDADLGNVPPEVQLDEGLLRDLRAGLKAAEPALVEARKLIRLRDGRFPIQWSKDGISTMINSQDARTTANLLRLEAALLAQDGHADAALGSTRGILVSARSVGDEPTLISMLIRIACASVAVNSLERVLAQGEPSPDELKRMQELLEAEADEPLLVIALRGERALDHQLMIALKDREVKGSVLGGGGPSGGSAMFDLAAPMLARGSHARILRLMTEMVETAKLPPEQQAEPLQAIELKVKMARVNYDVLTALIMPSVIKVSEAHRRDLAGLRCAIVAVAAERYRREHGAWPATAADLAPAFLKVLPTDPYDGQPLRYKRLTDGIIVYSVGPDKQDDGGCRNRSYPMAKGSDMGFRLWDVSKRRQRPAEVLSEPN
jgi:hypothetical protein